MKKQTTILRSLWPEGENGVRLTQEGWVKGEKANMPDGSVKIYKKDGLKIKIHLDEKGNIFGYPGYN